MKIRVGSIFTKIVVWFMATFVLSLVGYVATSMLLSARLAEPRAGRCRGSTRSSWTTPAAPSKRAGRTAGRVPCAARIPTPRPSISSSMATAWTWSAARIAPASWPMRASRTRARVRRTWPGFLRLAWSSGRDGTSVLVHSSRDRRYRLITVPPGRPHFATFELLAYFLWLPLLIGALCYMLAVHLASPLRGLRRVLEKFGRGDLAIRYHLARRDEIGDLAQAFNRMADQITTLLTAERRLLQDVSHELRSPLARLGFAVELARTSTDREAALGRIRKEAERLNNLVDELLQLTRAEGDPGARNLRGR